MDRRKRKTQTAIRKACLELIEEKSFESISVLDISERADISRGTFYLHYVDKFDMLEQFEKELMEKLSYIFLENLKGADSPTDFIKSRYPTIIQLFECFRDERELLQIIFKTKGIMPFQTNLIKLLENAYQDSVFHHTLVKSNSIPFNLFTPILVSIILGMAQYWMNAPEDYSPETLAKSIIDIMVNGLAKGVGLIPGELIDIDEFLGIKK